jgi:hypothetical protein
MKRLVLLASLLVVGCSDPSPRPQPAPTYRLTAYDRNGAKLGEWVCHRPAYDGDGRYYFRGEDGRERLVQAANVLVIDRLEEKE